MALAANRLLRYAADMAPDRPHSPLSQPSPCHTPAELSALALRDIPVVRHAHEAAWQHAQSLQQIQALPGVPEAAPSRDATRPLASGPAALSQALLRALFGAAADPGPPTVWDRLTPALDEPRAPLEGLEVTELPAPPAP